MSDDALEEFFARLAAEAGTPSLGGAEADEVLKLTKVVAHRVERRYAPLTSYVLGLALSGAMDPQERRARVRDLTEVVRRLGESHG